MIKKWFIRGLLLLTPILATFSILIWLFRFVDNLASKVITTHLRDYLNVYFNLRIPGLEIVVSVFVVIFVGALASFAGFFKWVESLFLNIPIIKKIYDPIRKITNLIFSTQPAFKQVVFVEYPRHGVYSLGFITNKFSIKTKDGLDKKLLNVYIPSSPYILTGFTLFLPEDQVIFIDISVEEATKIIMSGGMLNPEGEISYK